MDKPPVGQAPGEGDAKCVAGTEDTVQQREIEFAARGAREDERAAIHSARVDEARGILAQADKRDHEADDRDIEADRRDMAANLSSWVHDDDASGTAYEARLSAATDRSSSRADRTAAAVDRFNLAEDDDPRLPDPANDEDPPDAAPPPH